MRAVHLPFLVALGFAAVVLVALGPTPGVGARAVTVRSAAAGAAVPNLGALDRHYRSDPKGAIITCSSFMHGVGENVRGGFDAVCSEATYQLPIHSTLILRLPIVMSEVAMNVAGVSQADLVYRASARRVLEILLATTGGVPKTLPSAGLPSGVRAVAFDATARKSHSFHVTGVAAQYGTVVAVLIVVGANTPGEERVEAEVWPSWAAFFKTGR